MLLSHRPRNAFTQIGCVFLDVGRFYRRDVYLNLTSDRKVAGIRQIVSYNEYFDHYATYNAHLYSLFSRLPGRICYI